MTGESNYAKEYLSQALYIDQRITAKIQQMESLRDLSTRASDVLTGMPRTSNPSHMDDFVTKAIDLEAEIGADMHELINLKADIISVINSVATPEHRTLLEARYLCFRNWEVIAIQMYYDIRHIYRIHGKALGEVDAILRARQ